MKPRELDDSSLESAFQLDANYGFKKFKKS